MVREWEPELDLGSAGAQNLADSTGKSRQPKEWLLLKELAS